MPKIIENGESSGSLFLLPSGTRPRKHSADLDKMFGFRIKRVENKLSQKYQQYDQSISGLDQKQHFPGTEAWIGLSPDALQTPYNEIYDALQFVKDLEDLPIVKTIIDIGAAYGRVAFVKEELYPMSNFIGYEVVKKRQQEGQRVFDYQNLTLSELVFQNVLDENFFIPEAQIYFIYDFSDSGDISYILEKLLEQKKNFCLIAHGERTLNLLECQYNSIKKIHSLGGEKSLSVFTFSYDEICA